MAEEKICPLLADLCRRDQCMLYEKSEVTHVGESGSCAIYNISRHLKILAAASESKSSRKIV
ncbi:MAG: hypothetical protein RDV48_03310 [Candidatus Eremiobacteraeota bacterium]|nr:hypothetical protein [Candidatus Eremiobacteraeota bacterium]